MFIQIIIFLDSEWKKVAYHHKINIARQSHIKIWRFCSNFDFNKKFRNTNKDLLQLRVGVKIADPYEKSHKRR